jgi:acetyl-CoA acetyltransferase
VRWLQGLTTYHEKHKTTTRLYHILGRARQATEASWSSLADLNFPQASESGIFKEEILPIELRGTVVAKDDTVRPNVTAESLAQLKPVFKFDDVSDASTTAGNASGVGDGAAICVLMTRERAEREGADILGKWVRSTIVGMCEHAISDFYGCG